mgnify:CR=1 FL=1
MTELLKAEPGEHTDNRREYRNGSSERKRTTRAGTIELEVPRREGPCSPRAPLLIPPPPVGSSSDRCCHVAIAVVTLKAPFVESAQSGWRGRIHAREPSARSPSWLFFPEARSRLLPPGLPLHWTVALHPVSRDNPPTYFRSGPGDATASFACAQKCTYGLSQSRPHLMSKK